MATIINTPGGGDTDAGVSTGVILGIILAIAVIALLIIFRGSIFGTPNTDTTESQIPDRGLNANVNVNVPLPNGNSGGSDGSNAAY